MLQKEQLLYTLQKEQLLKGATIKSSYKNKQLSVKKELKIAPQEFRKESLSFLESELLHSFLVFFKFL